MKDKKYQIISSSSAGNAVIYHNEILVDIGVTFAKLSSYLPAVNIILLTHEHGDHFRVDTAHLIARERPDILWVVPNYLVKKVADAGVKNIYSVEMNRKYKVGRYRIEVYELFHDVPNAGYVIRTANYSLVHATDTNRVDHIPMKDLDLFAIEWNYDEIELNERIIEKLMNNEFAYEMRSKDYHLSFSKANDAISKNKKEDSEIIKLHMSARYLEKGE